MLRVFFILFMLGLMHSMCALAANDTLFYSGFEKPVTEEWGSTLETGLSVFERDTSASNHGSYGFQMVFNGAQQKGNLVTPANLNWEAGQQYLISFWYKVPVVPDNGNTNLKIFDASGAKLAQINISDWQTPGWIKFETTFTPETSSANGYVLFSFRPFNDGSGEYDLDDFTIEKVVHEANFWTSLKTENVPSDTSIRWVQFGPGMSGNNKCAFWHPTDPNTLFIGPNMGNSYVSFDQGKTYQTVLNEDETGFKLGDRGPIEFFSIDFSRQNPDFGMCSSERNVGIYVTHDRGATWTNMHIPEMEGKYVGCVAVDPNNDQIWYAGGGQMRNLGNMLFPDSQPHGTMVHEPSLQKLWKSTDGGKTWQLKNTGIHPKAQFETILVDPKYSNIIYATTNYGFYKSTDGGETWVQKTNGFDYDVMRAMDYHYNRNTDVLTLYVMCNPMWKTTGSSFTDDKGGLFKSTDRGETWQKLQGNLALDMRQFQNSYDIKNSYATCLSYVKGMSKEEFLQQYPDLPSKITIRFNTIAVDPNDPDNVYLNNEYSNASRNNFKPGGVWRSTDGGIHWHICLRNGKAWNPGSDDYNYWVSRGNPMGTNIHLRYLEEWTNRDVYERKGCNFVRWNADGTVLHTQLAKISLMSYDKGETWVDIDDELTTEGTRSIVGAGNSNVPGHGFYQHPDIDAVFCMSGENQLWITNDEGSKVREGAQAATSVRLVSDETSLSWYAVHPRNTQIHYALFFRQAKRGKLLKSTDAGKTWFEQGTAIPLWDLSAYSGDQSVHQLHLIIDPENPDYMFFCVPKSARDIEYVGNSVTGFGVHKSSDGGKTWKEANVGLPNEPDVTKICFDPANPQILYAAVQKAGGGLFVSNDRGETWAEVESTRFISGSYGINDIHFSVDGKAYITAGWKNGSPNDGGLWVSNDNMKTWSRIFDYPWTYRVETARYNPDVILLSTLPNTQIGSRNAGIYLSKDGGKSWVKINKGNGQSDRVNDIAIDFHKPGKYYASTYGSGWYVATDPNPAKVLTSVGNYSFKIAETPKIKVFPNPVSDKVHVYSEDANLNGAMLAVYNLSGQKVKSVRLQNWRWASFDFSGQRSGVYVLEIRGDGVHYKQKVIKN